MGSLPVAGSPEGRGMDTYKDSTTLVIRMTGTARDVFATFKAYVQAKGNVRVEALR